MAVLATMDELPAITEGCLYFYQHINLGNGGYFVGTTVKGLTLKFL